MKLKISIIMSSKCIFTLFCTFITLSAATHFSFSAAQRELEGDNTEFRISSFRSLLENVGKAEIDVPKFCGVAISLARYTQTYRRI
jgi:hypothetical protein